MGCMRGSQNTTEGQGGGRRCTAWKRSLQPHKAAQDLSLLAEAPAPWGTSEVLSSVTPPWERARRMKAGWHNPVHVAHQPSPRPSDCCDQAKRFNFVSKNVTRSGLLKQPHSEPHQCSPVIFLSLLIRPLARECVPGTHSPPSPPGHLLHLAPVALLSFLLHRAIILVKLGLVGGSKGHLLPRSAVIPSLQLLQGLQLPATPRCSGPGHGSFVRGLSSEDGILLFKPPL